MLLFDNDPAGPSCQCDFLAPAGMPLATEAASIRLALPGTGLSAAFTLLIDENNRAVSRPRFTRT